MIAVWAAMVKHSQKNQFFRQSFDIEFVHGSIDRALGLLAQGEHVSVRATPLLVCHSKASALVCCIVVCIRVGE